MSRTNLYGMAQHGETPAAEVDALENQIAYALAVIDAAPARKEAVMNKVSVRAA